MFSVYLAALVFGGLTMLLQSFLSSGEGELDASEVELEAGTKVAPQGASNSLELAGRRHGGGLLSVVLSLRFYLFGSLGFGLVGTSATFWQVAAADTVLAVSSLVGLFLGGTVCLLFRWLHQSAVGSSLPSGALTGKLGRVLVACQPEKLGKVRIEVMGQFRDYLATTDETGGLSVGEETLVLETRSEKVHVCRSPHD